MAEPALPRLMIRRSFDAPADLVYRMWTDPQHIARWWGPHHYTVPYAEFDARPGGALRIDFRAPDGFTFANHGRVIEVDPPHRLVFEIDYCEDGRLMVTQLVTVTFEEKGAATAMLMDTQVTFAEPEAADSLAGMEEGWTQQLDKLALDTLLSFGRDEGLVMVAPEGRPVTLTKRIFDAPRALVWACLTEPAHVARWSGRQGDANAVTMFDLRPGGGWRIEGTAADGETSVFSGTYSEVTPPDRLAFAIEEQAGGEIRTTQILEEIGGLTHLTEISTFAAPGDRDAMVESGMERAAAERFARLDAVLEDLKSGKDMASATPASDAAARPELTMVRSFAAPRELVFRAWTEPQMLGRWSCPRGFTLPFAESDISEGGAYRTCMRGPDGTDHWLGGVYREIASPSRLVFTHSWLDEDGRPEHETLVTVTFEETPDGATRMRFNQAFFPTESSRDGHRGGWSESFDKLDDLLAALG